MRRDQNLASILSFVEERVVANDYTISWLGQHYRIPLDRAKARMRKAKLRVEQRLTGELVARWQDRQMVLVACRREKTPAPAASPRKPAQRKTVPNRDWMKSFWAGDPAKRLAGKRSAQSPPTGSTS